MTFWDACFYFVTVTINLQLNNLCRVPRLLACLIYSAMRFGSFRPHYKALEAAYYLAINSSMHRWLREDGHLYFPNCAIWARDADKNRTWLDRHVWQYLVGNSVRRWNMVVVHLDHERRSAISVALDETMVTDPYEVLVLTCMIIPGYSHLAVHLSASQVSQCVDTWPLARRAQASVNGLGYAAANVVAPLLASNLADHQQVLWNNGHNPTPHPRSRTVHSLLMLHSDTYRMMFRAHSDPLILEAAGGNQMKVSAIIQGSLMHGIDHFILDVYSPCWQSSRVLGGNGYTMTGIFGVGHNADFTATYCTPQDEVTRRLKRIVAEESLWLASGYQWAVCE
jgi:hypothetical protein